MNVNVMSLCVVTGQQGRCVCHSMLTAAHHALGRFLTLLASQASHRGGGIFRNELWSRRRLQEIFFNFKSPRKIPDFRDRIFVGRNADRGNPEFFCGLQAEGQKLSLVRLNPVGPKAIVVTDSPSANSGPRLQS